MTISGSPGADAGRAPREAGIAREAREWITADDGRRLALSVWAPADGAADEDGAPMPRAVIQLVHGMGEHTARYGAFARRAVEAGYAVVADDHRGHGLTMASPDESGHTADADGAERILADLAQARGWIGRAFPGLPVILIGHSWGSILARVLAPRLGAGPGADPAAAIAGLILVGTTGSAGILAAIGPAVTRALCLARGPRRRERILDALVLGPYSKPFSPGRTRYDWLSRDEAVVDAFVADPLCGFDYTNAFYRDLVDLVRAASNRAIFNATPAGLPILLLSGAQDPVGAMGKGPRWVGRRYARAGACPLGLRLYPGARHEALNETNRDEVMGDILDWIARVV
ncbi:alpha/beta fold hydrolase [Actinomyces sp. zg328]|uniref:alpha/beta fold hydrolase n=1 Tax=Actinomyces sp. zg328 TaxID=2609287 RepID=UPI00135C9D9D|nr:alpha/beta hydrolase [Actinomyces sp. zg328]